jgi:CheY-like chemotaxis protein
VSGPSGRAAEPYARILVIDDNPAIAESFARVLGPPTHDDELRRMEQSLFGPAETDEPDDAPSFAVDAAESGELGCELARRARFDGRPYALAFVDMRMPGGWDGLRTIEELWRRDDLVQVVICTAYCDYEWSEIVDRLGRSDQLLILQKPFDPVEAREIARSRTAKWKLARTR